MSKKWGDIVNNRSMLLAIGVFLGFGVVTIRKGIAARKTADIVLGAICLLGAAALVTMAVIVQKR